MTHIRIVCDVIIHMVIDYYNDIDWEMQTELLLVTYNY